MSAHRGRTTARETPRGPEGQRALGKTRESHGDTAPRCASQLCSAPQSRTGGSVDSSVRRYSFMPLRRHAQACAGIGCCMKKRRCGREDTKGCCCTSSAQASIMVDVAVLLVRPSSHEHCRFEVLRGLPMKRGPPSFQPQKAETCLLGSPGRRQASGILTEKLAPRSQG